MFTINKVVFSKNRKRLMEKLNNNSVVILFAGNAPKKSADENYDFTPNRNFYYFTGITEEEHIIVLSKINNNVEEVLFLKEINLEMERWLGKTLRDSEAKEISNVSDVRYMDGFKSFLNTIFSNSENLNLYLDLESDNYDDLYTLPQSFAQVINKKYPNVWIKNVRPLVRELRIVKSSEEVQEIKDAIDITIEGVENIMKNIEPGMKEYQAEAYFEFACKTRGVKDYAFKTIAASGVNAATLHYTDNNSEAKDGDLILFDLGATSNYYNADITRTFPVNGRFTERQKDVYNAVLRVNEKVIKEIKPEVEYKKLNDKARDWIADECIKLGLMKEKSEISKYYWHSIGHSLGLDTHDICAPDRNTIFKEGMVWTVEPEIYIQSEGIGIRIEDDVLVTSKGVEVLTKNMIKSVKDIEDFMKNKQNE